MIQTVAVVDAGPHTVTVWPVNVGTGAPGISRMSGAWVLHDEPHKVELLTRGKPVAATPAGAEALQSASATPAGMLDLTDTVNAVTAERDRLQAIYNALPASRKKTLVAPRWPHMPPAVDLADPLRAQTTDDNVAAALGVARFLEQLATAWADLERQRTVRDYLTEGAAGQPAEIRDFPLCVSSVNS
jgi:hypothetical protein